ncbi:MAG: hypothetical protein KTR24_09535 [Saprospiraceae bacterium]|nr:hypothetical protein [Saprospiraceae bacterium]
MNMVIQKLEKLEEKVKVMTQKLEYLRKENMMLIEENVRLKDKSEGAQAIESKGQKAIKVENLQVEKMKRDLDKYIVDLDKCLEMINNM